MVRSEKIIVTQGLRHARLGDPQTARHPHSIKAVHQASIMQKGRGVALPRDIDPRANIDPFHPNTPSSRRVNLLLLLLLLLLRRLAALFTALPLFLFHLRIAFSCLPLSPLLYTAASCF